MKTIFKRLTKASLAIVLTVCLLFSCLTVGIIATNAAKVQSEKVGINATVYFYNEDSWSNPYIWAWKSSGDTTNYTGNKWPGEAMSAVSGKTKLYSYSLYTDAGQMIFSDEGNNQTDTITAPSSAWSGKIYDKGSGNWYPYAQYDALYNSRVFSKPDRAAKGKDYFSPEFELLKLSFESILDAHINPSNDESGGEGFGEGGEGDL